mmetsp:Transcript_24120/g.57198  ORF Transcript_24120/g.57198 Transcript_24120/m.57198 type:complete len:128 (+) Transcript_24120:1977-2360(+)
MSVFELGKREPCVGVNYRSPKHLVISIKFMAEKFNLVFTLCVVWCSTRRQFLVQASETLDPLNGQPTKLPRVAGVHDNCTQPFHKLAHSHSKLPILVPPTHPDELWSCILGILAQHDRDRLVDKTEG